MSYLTDMYSMAPVIAIDFETTARHKGDYFAATPYDHANHVVLGGLLSATPSGGAVEEFIGAHSKNTPSLMGPHYALEEVMDALLCRVRENLPRKTLLVGVNLGFDLSYIMRHFPLTWDDMARNIVIWDCAAAEYFLSGQFYKYPSMNQMAERYNLPQKPDTLKSYMDAGVDVEDIPVDELTTYLQHDLATTLGIFVGQVNKIASSSNTSFDTFYLKMEDILMTTTMECNGMNFDKGIADDLAMTTMTELAEVEEEVTGIARHLSGQISFNIHSNAQLSTLFYGGSFKRDTTEVCTDESGAPILFKSGAKKGLVKTKRVEVIEPFAGILSQVYPDKSVDEERLTVIQNDLGTPPGVIGFITGLLRARVLRKDLTTYYIGYAKFAELDGALHTSLNQTATGTGRLSSSRPNLQNCAHDSGE